MKLENTVEAEHMKLKILVGHIYENGVYSPDGYAEFKRELERIEHIYPSLHEIYNTLDMYHFRLMH